MTKFRPIRVRILFKALLRVGEGELFYWTWHWKGVRWELLEAILPQVVKGTCPRMEQT